MTGFNNNNKNLNLIGELKTQLNTPKTYEVRYLEDKTPQSLSKIATFFGLNQVECSGNNDNSLAKIEKMDSQTTKVTAPKEKWISQDEIKSTTDNLAEVVNKHGSQANAEYKTEGGNKKTGGYYSESVNYDTRKQ